MTTAEAIQAIEEGVLARRWDANRTAWVAVGIPLIEPPGSAPPRTLADFFDEIGLFAAVPNDKIAETHVVIARGELPELIFREAIFWLHKSLHVLGASESHVSRGFPTWSLSEAYQSAFFAARSIMAFLGVAVGEVDRNSVVVDICRDVRGFTPRKMEEQGAFLEDILLKSPGSLFGHAHIWRLFQRLIKVTTRLPWPQDWNVYFADLQIPNITRQRHQLHYHVGYWVKNDLHFPDFDESFGDMAPTGHGRTMFEERRANLTLVTAHTLARMAMSLLRSFHSVTRRLDRERELLEQVTTAERHPLCYESLVANPA